MVEPTPSNNICQNGNLPQGSGVKIKILGVATTATLIHYPEVMFLGLKVYYHFFLGTGGSGEVVNLVYLRTGNFNPFKFITGKRVFVE